MYYDIHLCVQHLFIHFFHGHAPAKHCGHGQVSAMMRVACCHHVLVIEHLLSELGHREGAVLLGSATGQRCETWDEEVQARERYHVHGQLSQVCIQLKSNECLKAEIF